MATLSEIVATGELDSYEPSAPWGDFGGVDAGMIDAQMAAEAICTRCRHRGLAYFPFRSAQSYRAFAVCPACDQAEEF
jgi:hypothetical protein